MEETVVTKKEFDCAVIDPFISSADKEALRHMKTGMYLIKKGDMEGTCVFRDNIHMIMKKGTIDRLLRLDYIHESEINPNRFLLTQTGLLITKYY